MRLAGAYPQIKIRNPDLISVPLSGLPVSRLLQGEGLWHQGTRGRKNQAIPGPSTVHFQAGALFFKPQNPPYRA